MAKNDFFENQTRITALKIYFYKKYIGKFIIKNLMRFGHCIVSDLFCGPGKNGKNDGSPLVLLNEAEEMLKSPALLKKKVNPRVGIVFNDEDAAHVAQLKKEILGRKLSKGIILAEITSYTFDEVIKRILPHLKAYDNYPKFFFLDPFGYSDVDMGHILSIVELEGAEILLFSPTFDAYRFSNSSEPLPEKTVKFLNAFTTRGIADYKDIDDFNNSIQMRLKQELGLDFIRTIILDDGKRKHTLIYFTSHIVGMIEMNNIFWKMSQDNKRVYVKGPADTGQLDLFGKNDFCPIVDGFKEKLFGKLRRDKVLTNKDIIFFGTTECIKLSVVADIVRDLIKKCYISAEYLTDKKKSVYITKDYWYKDLVRFVFNETKGEK